MIACDNYRQTEMVYRYQTYSLGIAPGLKELLK
jgi:hypothetical protein